MTPFGCCGGYGRSSSSGSGASAASQSWREIFDAMRTASKVPAAEVAATRDLNGPRLKDSIGDKPVPENQKKFGARISRASLEEIVFIDFNSHRLDLTTF
jgi:hypothetical protein